MIAPADTSLAPIFVSVANGSPFALAALTRALLVDKDALIVVELGDDFLRQRLGNSERDSARKQARPRYCSNGRLYRTPRAELLSK